MKTTFITLVLIFSVTILFAQKATFTGTYNINKSKIDFGQAPQWILPIRYKISTDGDKFVIVRINTDQNGTESDRTLSFSSNNTFEYTAPSGSKVKTTLQWSADGTQLTFDQQSVAADSKQGLIVKETWSLADNGKTLVADRHVEQPDGLKYDIKAYYDKQGN
jgi:predicted GH43/DUF377 family glycosyl hydrolase